MSLRAVTQALRLHGDFAPLVTGRSSVLASAERSTCGADGLALSFARCLASPGIRCLLGRGRRCPTFRAAFDRTAAPHESEHPEHRYNSHGFRRTIRKGDAP
jgi:hypothetical protein